MNETEQWLALTDPCIDKFDATLQVHAEDLSIAGVRYFEKT